MQWVASFSRYGLPQRNGSGRVVARHQVRPTPASACRAVRELAFPYGVFTADDGAMFRHHDLAHLHTLLEDLRLVEQRQIEVVTMNGNQARAVQLLLRKP